MYSSSSSLESLCVPLSDPVIKYFLKLRHVCSPSTAGTTVFIYQNEIAHRAHGRGMHWLTVTLPVAAAVPAAQ